jgi:16S rRNA (cytosine967-C5)-methyltransferase
LRRNQEKPQSPDGPRKTAWRILIDWETGAGSLESIREGYFGRVNTSPKDRALAIELTQGVARHRLFLEHNLRCRLDRPDAPLPEPVRQALFLGIYQMLLLDRIPPHAAVDETVRLLKGSRFAGFASLVNAVLRKVSSSGSAPIPCFEEDPMRFIQLTTSSPGWLVESLAVQEGEGEALKILQALNRKPSLTLRVNTLRTNRSKLLDELDLCSTPARPGKLSDTAVIVQGNASPADLPPFLEGRCVVQDEGAQMVAPLLSPLPGQRILDGCAAPGGKTGHLAQITRGNALIAAADISLPRVHMMAGGLARLGIKSATCLAADLSPEGSCFIREAFDRILLDVPCSGTGVLRRHPEGKWNKDLSSIRILALKQHALLTSVAGLLRQGGRLLYSTCSLLRIENEDVVDRFLAGASDLIRLDLREIHPHLRRDIFSARGELRLWPHRHDCDGFFACLMEKEQSRVEN